MRHPRATWIAVLLASLLAGPACDDRAGAAGPAPDARADAAPDYGETFWSHWGDGKAELAGYDLIFPRYGELRRGVAVTIVVTEPFAVDARVKSEDPRRPADRTVPVLKLNLVQDVPTGIYDYNLMTSAFVALRPLLDRPAGAATKISFSSQEWCGQAWSQVLFDADAARHVSHSYFDGEGDASETLAYPAGGLAEDALPLWARGLAGPVLGPGERREVALLRSLETVRLRHVAADWDRAVLSRLQATEHVTVPAGEFDADVLTVEVAEARARATYPPAAGEIALAPRTWTFWVEHAAPRRLVRWTRSDGLEASLLSADRLAYWTMNGGSFRDAVGRLGLEPRPARTP